MDTLAAAYAEAGEFQQALDIAEKAMQSAEDLGMEDLVRQIMERKKGYEKREPYRQTLPRKP